MSKKLALALALSFGLFGTTGASAADFADGEGAQPASTGTANPSIYSTSLAATTAAASEGTTSGWEFEVTPYLWASGMKVDIDTAEGEKVHVDKSFLDVLDILNFSLMGAFEARRGRFVTFHDLFYISIETEDEGNIGPGLVEAKVGQKLLATTHLAGYRVVDKGPMFLDVMAGARITTLKLDLKLSGPFNEVKRDSSETKVGPVIASRFRAPLGGRWGLAIYGDLGGFGVTSDLSWQLMGNVQYELGDHWRMYAGWRHFSAKQDTNGFDADLSLDGPIFGATYRF